MSSFAKVGFESQNISRLTVFASQSDQWLQ